MIAVAVGAFAQHLWKEWRSRQLRNANAVAFERALEKAAVEPEEATRALQDAEEVDRLLSKNIILNSFVAGVWAVGGLMRAVTMWWLLKESDDRRAHWALVGMSFAQVVVYGKIVGAVREVRQLLRAAVDELEGF